MTSRRMIAADMFEDDTICAMAVLGRFTWIGMVVTCADDQGRMIDNTAIIRAKVFPLDQGVTDADIESALAFQNIEGKIARYVAGKKRLIQIVNWWRYQAPSWAMPSKYPPPDGWVDREKYHTSGIKNGVTQKNWDMQGGYSQPPTALPSALPNALSKSTDESRGEESRGEESRGEESRGAEAEAKPAAAAAPTARTDAVIAYEQNIGLPTPHILQAITDDEKEFSVYWVIEAIKEAVQSEGRSYKYVHAILVRWKREGFKNNKRQGTGPPGNGRKTKQDELVDHNNAVAAKYRKDHPEFANGQD